MYEATVSPEALALNPQDAMLKKLADAIDNTGLRPRAPAMCGQQFTMASGGERGVLMSAPLNAPTWCASPGWLPSQAYSKKPHQRQGTASGAWRSSGNG